MEGKNFRYKSGFIVGGLVKKISEYGGSSPINEIEFDKAMKIDFVAKWLRRRDWPEKLLEGDDVIHGGKYDDKIWGGPGDDKIHGEEGMDTINGGPGDDVIFGGKTYWKNFSRTQQATGGAGEDTFVLDRGSHLKILDFDLKNDKLNFAGNDFELQKEGSDAISVRDEDGYWMAWLEGVNNIDAVEVIY